MFILIDIGGTKTRVGSSFDLTSLSTSEVFYTEKNYSSQIQNIFTLIDKISEKRRISAICIGIAGTLNTPKTKLTLSPNLPNFVNKKIQRNFQEKYGCPTFLENDTAVVGLGEATYGVGKNSNLLAYITVSTGFGGVRIENGSISLSTFGFEPGHQVIDIVESKPRTLEELSSGRGRDQFVKEGWANENVYWEEANKYLAIGLNNIVLSWSVDTVVLGGGIIINDIINLNKVKKNLLSILKSQDLMPKILKAKLGDFGGLYGGMQILKNKKNHFQL